MIDDVVGAIVAPFLRHRAHARVALGAYGAITEVTVFNPSPEALRRASEALHELQGTALRYPKGVVSIVVDVPAAGPWAVVAEVTYSDGRREKLSLPSE